MPDEIHRASDGQPIEGFGREGMGVYMGLRRRAALFTVAGLAALTPLATTGVRALASLPEGGAVQATTIQTAPCGWAATPPIIYQHVIWIWFEDSHLTSVIGNAAAPYITNLAKTQCAYSRGWLDNILSDAPQYVPATAGANCSSGNLHNITPAGDTCITSGAAPAKTCTSTTCKNTVAITSIFEQVQNKVQNTTRDSWKAYEESMPSNCSTAGQAGNYLGRHNPPPYFNHLRIALQFLGNTCATNDVVLPATSCNGTSCTVAASPNSLLDDLTNNTLPTFSFVTPNMCDDMHTKCAPYASRVTNGDQWLAAWLPQIIQSQAYQSGSTAVFIMWDETAFNAALPNVIVAPSVVPGTALAATTTINNIAALGSTEDMLGLARIGCAAGGLQPDGSACPTGSATSLRSLFKI
jgi:hypothetical protein